MLSTFPGKNEFLGQEVLNLAARRNLLYRVLDRSLPGSQKLEGLRGVLYVDSDPPAAGLKAQLDAFVRTGGLLIVPHALAAEFAGREAGPLSGRRIRSRSLGKGLLATAARDWEDPYFLAADVHNLVSRRNEPVRSIQCPFFMGALFRRCGRPQGVAPVGGFHQSSHRVGEHGAGAAMALGRYVCDRVPHPHHAGASGRGRPAGTSSSVILLLRGPGVSVVSR